MPPRARAVMPINRRSASARSCGISFVAPEAREDTMDAATKDELLNQAARDYKAFHETLAGLNEAQMSEVWLGTWSVGHRRPHLGLAPRDGPRAGAAGARREARARRRVLRRRRRLERDVRGREEGRAGGRRAAGVRQVPRIL